MPIVATKFSSALDLLIDTSKNTNKLLEVNSDGSIREQNWKEKLVNFGSKLVGRYQLRKDTKDAAVADALNNLANKTLNGSDQIEKNILNLHAKSIHKYGALDRYREAKLRVEARTTPRNIEVRPDSDTRNRVRSDSISSLQARGTTSYGATEVSAPRAKVYTAEEKSAAKAAFLNQFDQFINDQSDYNRDYIPLTSLKDDLQDSGEIDFDKIRGLFENQGLNFDGPELAKFAAAEQDIVAWHQAQQEGV